MLVFLFKKIKVTGVERLDEGINISIKRSVMQNVELHAALLSVKNHVKTCIAS
jgi:hypothetical protein